MDEVIVRERFALHRRHVFGEEPLQLTQRSRHVAVDLRRVERGEKRELHRTLRRDVVQKLELLRRLGNRPIEQLAVYGAVEGGEVVQRPVAFVHPRRLSVQPDRSRVVTRELPLVRSLVHGHHVLGLDRPRAMQHLPAHAEHVAVAARHPRDVAGATDK